MPARLAPSSSRSTTSLSRPSRSRSPTSRRPTRPGWATSSGSASDPSIALLLALTDGLAITRASLSRYKKADICVAVATPTGLITPIIKDAGGKGLAAISSETKALAAKARDGKLKPEEYQGGSFTVSNLGMFGVSHFTAIINPPQSCILAVGATSPKVVPSASTESGFETVNVMNVTLTADHRTVDGAVGAQFLKAFKGYMENPLTFML